LIECDGCHVCSESTSLRVPTMLDQQSVAHDAVAGSDACDDVLGGHRAAGGYRLHRLDDTAGWYREGFALLQE
jgi:hypothetical protein